MDRWERKVSETLRVMGEPSRFKILRYLTEAPRNVSEIVRALGMGQSLVSHHLKVLKEHGLLEANRQGPFVRYRVTHLEVKEIFLLAETLVKKLKEARDV